MRTDENPTPNTRRWTSWCSCSLPLYLTALFLVILVYTWRLWLLKVRGFDPDEFVYLHGAWAISKGQLPYIDFFEHHTPWLHFFLAPFYAFFDVEANVDDGFAFLFLARRLMWVFTGIILALTFWLGKLWRDFRIACAGTLFLSNTGMFLTKTLEVRPAVLAMLFWLACLAMLLGAMRLDANHKRECAWRFAWSGAFLGAGIMCTQKLLLALPGFAVAMLWYLLDSRSHGNLSYRFGNLLWQFIGFAVPILITLGYFLLHNGLSQFVEYNLLMNLRWQARYASSVYLQQLLRQNPLLVILGVIGFFRAFFLMFHRSRFRHGDYLLVLNALGLFLGLYLIPAPLPQYYVLFLPLVAIFAATSLVEGVDSLTVIERRSWCLSYKLRGVLYGLFTIGMASYAFYLVEPQIHELALYLAFWAMTLMGVHLFLLHGSPGFALALLVIAISAYPIAQMRQAFDWKNSETLANISYVLNNTSPEDTVMDGRTGLGVYRPHAYFYFFLHEEIRAIVTESERQELLANLRSGAISPKLIFLDEDLKSLSAEITSFFEEHFEPTDKSPIWRLKEDP